MKILFIAPLPPPITGNSLSAKILFDELNKYHRVVPINLSKGSFKQGINSFKRIIRIARVLKEVWLKSKDVDIIYVTISQSFLEILEISYFILSVSKVYLELLFICMVVVLEN